MRIVAAAEMRAIEARAAAAGTPEPVLMDRAARAVAATVERVLGGVRGKRILVLVGPGNNGGDGLWSAYYLHERGAAVACYCWHRPAVADPSTPDAPAAAARKTGIPLIDAGVDGPDGARLGRLLPEAAAIVDGLFGMGLQRPVAGEPATIIARVREGVAVRAAAGRPLPVFAIDVPSGVDSDTGRVWGTALPAAWTVTLGVAKQGLFQYPAAGLAGTVVLGDIGVADLSDDVKTTTTEARQVGGLLPARPADANKGTFGRLLIVAGSVNYIGAGVLNTLGALRSGVGLATLAVPIELLPIVASKVTEATFIALPSDLGVLIERSVEPVLKALAQREYAALVVGCGLGQERETQAFIRGLLLKSAEAGAARSASRAIGFGSGPQLSAPHTAAATIGFGSSRRAEPAGPHPPEPAPRPLPPLVIDADGLNLLSEIDGWAERLPPGNVLTPHPGEMSRLTGKPLDEIQADRVEAARAAAAGWQQVVVLKGANTVIAAPDGRVQINPAATPALASAGTGDVLAGVIGSLIAQGLAPFDAAVAGVWLHGHAGEICAERIGLAGVLASEVAAALPAAIADALRARQG